MRRGYARGRSKSTSIWDFRDDRATRGAIGSQDTSAEAWNGRPWAG